VRDLSRSTLERDDEAFPVELQRRRGHKPL
jgi:hypothetical protein